MKIEFKKNNLLAPSFATKDRESLTVSSGVFVEKTKLSQPIRLPKKLTPGTDYAIRIGRGELTASALPTAKIPANALGGFHADLDGAILPSSIWDLHYRPKCPDPRGMSFVETFGWNDIYLLNTNALEIGSSQAGKQIADGRSHIKMPNGKMEPLTWWNAKRVLQALGKDLLSRDEFTAITEGVKENTTNTVDPETTQHAPGMKSRFGIEQATGCMWTWLRDVHLDGDWMYVAGGGWVSVVAGPRQFYGNRPSSDWYGFGARGRCDHLTPVKSGAIA